jgi:cobalt/nickel transport system permease protein
MHVHFLDPYRPAESPVHALDALVKLLLALGFILTTSLLPVGAWAVYIILFALIFSAEILSELGSGYVLRRSALALPFMLAALPLIFTTPGPALASIPVGAWSISLPGVERFTSITIKSWLSVQAAILLAVTTPFPEILKAFRRLRLPRLLVAMIGLMWRYLFILVDEALRLTRARAARSGLSAQTARPGGSLGWRAQVTGGMAGSLFLRSLERSDRVYLAMVSRGYDGEIRSLPGRPIRAAERLALIAGFSAYALLLILAFILNGISNA